MKTKTTAELQKLVAQYDSVMEVMEHNAAKSMRDDNRAYGGFVRAAKGKMQEFITESLIRVAWDVEMAADPSRLIVNSEKIKIPIQKSYIDAIKDSRLKKYITANMTRHTYGLSVDKHVFIDRKFFLGIECKAYTENAMIKRILVDFYLLKTRFPNLHCFLFQLESQLGGDYSTAGRYPLGSFPTHTIMSYFQNVDLNIVTLLEGERKVDRPINKPDFFKPLKVEHLETAVGYLLESLNGVFK
ncbi:MAG: restriction endonuclease [Proteobacteria bacterium]|nr:restriction endonuclease [Pseudomonadota bacterium]